MAIVQRTMTNSFTESIELALCAHYQELAFYGCTYMYYTVNHASHGRLRFTTNEDWINVYLDECLIHDDPVKFICEQKVSRIITWNNIPIAGIKQNRVMEARKTYKLFNGLNVVYHDPNSGLQKIIGLCTDMASHNLAAEIFADGIMIQSLTTNILNLV
jgi:hypothetical protein